MKIRILDSIGNREHVFDSVPEAGLYLMAHYRSQVDDTMGKMTLARLREYAEELPVESITRIDHSVTAWKKV